MAQQRRPEIVTPKGVAVYPHLNKPDTKFNPDGEFKVNLKLSPEDGAALADKLNAILDEYFQAEVKKDPKIARYNKQLPMDDEIDDQGNLTGDVVFKFKQAARKVTQKGDTIEFKIALFDAKRTPITDNVGGGSTIKVAATVWPYTMPTTKTVGLSLRPYAVQVIDLKTFGGGGAASAFDDEDGYTTSSGAAAFGDDADDQDEDVGNY